MDRELAQNSYECRHTFLVQKEVYSKKRNFVLKGTMECIYRDMFAINQSIKHLNSSSFLVSGSAG